MHGPFLIHCDSPDMYALSPRALGIHIKQITHAYVTTITCHNICM